MKNFEFYKATNLIFGNNQLFKLGNEIKKHTNKKILLTYGGGSIKATGLYDEVIEELDKSNIEYIELFGIKPNPETDTARAGIKLIKENNIDFILAVGGGSVLDNTKHMAIGSQSDLDIWDLFNDPIAMSKITNLPKIGSIITLAATGSEMNNGGVITNPEFNIKKGVGHPNAAPVFTFENPEMLHSLPLYQRQAGICDILSHLLEVYFGEHKDDMLTDRIVEAIMINIIDNYNDYLENNNYDTHASVFLSSTLALNGLTGLGRDKADWISHNIEHEISAYTDLTHGIGLAIVHPNVLAYYLDFDIKNNNDLIKFINLGKNVFKLQGDGKDIALSTIDALRDLFYSVSNVKTLKDVKIEDFNIEQSASKLISNGSIGSYIPLTKKDIINIFNTLWI
ncbi:MAG: iron-containing alcohol dehydrogenase [Mycoplasmatales bacterium]